MADTRVLFHATNDRNTKKKQKYDLDGLRRSRLSALDMDGLSPSMSTSTSWETEEEDKASNLPRTRRSKEEQGRNKTKKKRAQFWDSLYEMERSVALIEYATRGGQSNGEPSTIPVVLDCTDLFRSSGSRDRKEATSTVPSSSSSPVPLPGSKLRKLVRVFQQLYPRRTYVLELILHHSHAIDRMSTTTANDCYTAPNDAWKNHVLPLYCHLATMGPIRRNGGKAFRCSSRYGGKLQILWSPSSSSVVHPAELTKKVRTYNGPTTTIGFDACTVESKK